MSEEKSTRTIDTAFVLVLFCVFVITILLVLMTGANVYKQTSKTMAEGFDKRTCVSMLIQKIRNYDSEGAISVKDIDGCNALVFSENISGDEYVTYIYYYDGNIKELFVPEKYDFKASDGNDLMTASGFTATIDDKLLTFKYKIDGEEITSCINLKSGEVFG